mmetsp:Transcript_57874/g.66053  ORF Transcript_57874/g.66053 Transcript_57874/m.66053 type:complete len:148 (+) Transcript_57874:119-562(+)
MSCSHFSQISLGIKKTDHGIKKEANSSLMDHQEEQGIVCNFLGCGARFKDRFNTRRHILQVHTLLRPFRCHICSAKFGLKHHYLSHIQRHGVDQQTLNTLRTSCTTLKQSLPLFCVKNTTDEELLHDYIKNRDLPNFVETGVLPEPN